MATMNISLPDAMKEWVDQQVATGRYANASDYVRDILRRDQERVDRIAEFEKLVEEGLNSPRVKITRDELLARMRLKAAAALDAEPSP